MKLLISLPTSTLHRTVNTNPLLYKIEDLSYRLRQPEPAPRNLLDNYDSSLYTSQNAIRNNRTQERPESIENLQKQITQEINDDRKKGLVIQFNRMTSHN